MAGNTSIIHRFDEDGKPAVMFREEDASDWAILRPIREQLLAVAEMLGDDEPRVDEAMELLKRTSLAFQQAVQSNPGLQDDTRYQAQRDLRKVIRELQNVQALLRQGG